MNLRLMMNGGQIYYKFNKNLQKSVIIYSVVC